MCIKLRIIRERLLLKPVISKVWIEMDWYVGIPRDGDGYVEMDGWMDGWMVGWMEWSER